MANNDPHIGVTPGLDSRTYSRSFAITPGSALPYPTRAIFVPPGGGDLTLTTLDDANAATYKYGSAWPGGLQGFRASAVATWTGAAGLIGLA